jgi:very-short-patch-repair endonuclease
LAGVKFRRQFPIGNYILDFYSPEYGFGIEADGGQHYGVEVRQNDETRTEELSKLGIEILRFNDREILNNTEGVWETIEKTIKRKRLSPSPQSSPLGERT